MVFDVWSFMINNMINKSGTLFVLSAPSGAGKTTLTQGLLKRVQRDCKFERVVTYTSRQPRVGEVHGKDYYFISELEFKAKIERNDFIEWSQAYGAFYGSPRHELEKLSQGISLLMILDIHGATLVMDSHRPVTIWITPPDLNVLRERLYNRGSDHEDAIELRLELARQELAHKAIKRFSYQLINDNLSVALDKLENIVRNEMNAAESPLPESFFEMF